MRTGAPLAMLLLCACAREAAEADVAGNQAKPAAAAQEPGNASGTQPTANAAEDGAKPAPPPPAAAAACLSQDGQPVPANRLRAIGTEPFWGARIEGRCVTYSHPEDQQGTRVWTRFAGTAANGSWTGALGGAPFVLRTRPEPGCSDGMSDNRYPIAVSLTVGGEQRTGCAEPL